MGKLDDSAAIAVEMIALRAEQDILFGVPLGRNHAWDIVLHLFVADAKGESLTGREAIRRAGARFETGKRLLSYLVRSEIIIGDGDLNPDALVALSAKAVTLVEQHIMRIRQFQT